ncbi:MAG: hypothetical protein HN348_25385, partial [Proteobacteria bacterium]|nr:hypothetical protein [Pseudomonadota bacterium]
MLLVLTISAWAGTLTLTPETQEKLTTACLAGENTACLEMAVAVERRWAWSYYQQALGYGYGAPDRWYQATAFRARACELGDSASCRWAARLEGRDVEETACLAGDTPSCARLSLPERRLLCESHKEHAVCDLDLPVLGSYPLNWHSPTSLSWGIVDLGTGQWTDGQGTVVHLVEGLNMSMTRHEDEVSAMLLTPAGTLFLTFDGVEAQLELTPIDGSTKEVPRPPAKPEPPTIEGVDDIL